MLEIQYEFQKLILQINILSIVHFDRHVRKERSKVVVINDTNHINFEKLEICVYDQNFLKHFYTYDTQYKINESICHF
jgi:hypothetical protein